MQEREGHGGDPRGEPVAAPRSPRRWRTFVPYACAAAASVVAAVVFLQLWAADLRVPFAYHGDSLVFGMLVKSIVDHGWYLTNPHLGAPGVLATHDFPFPDGFHLLLIKAMAWFSSDWALLFNLYFLLGFPLITLSALAVFRHFRVAYGPAFVASLLYAFLPSRLIKGESHLFLDVFYQVPLAILVALWVCGDKPPLPRNRGRLWAAIVICAITAGTGLYYAFFTGALIFLGGIWASIQRRTMRNALSGLALTAVIVAGLGVQGLPTFVHDWRHGRNSQVAARSHFESEVYAMRMTQLLLPVSGHRIPALRELKERYDASAPFRGESSDTGLGLVGSVGFLVLLGLILIGPRPERPREELLRPLAVFNLLAVLLATMGGIGSLFALLVTPEVRTYARMNVIIAFLSLFAVALLLERVRRPVGRLAPLFPLVVVVVGLLDQVTPAAIRPYRQVKLEYLGDDAFVRSIEAAVPPDAMVFELPYVLFPEAGRVAGRGMGDYDLLQPYLHSRTVRWSYPTMYGRIDDAWASEISHREPVPLVRTLTDAGFHGIYINRRGYVDDAAQIESEIARELGAGPAVSPDGRLSFFGLAAHARQAHAGLTPEERERRRDLALHPTLLRWTAGALPPEQGAEGTFRWCSKSGTIEIDNDAHVEQTAVLMMTVSPAQPPAMLRMEGDLWSETIELPGPGVRVSRTLKVSPGHHVLRFHSNGRPADAPYDPRRHNLIWRAENVRLEDVVGPP